MQEQLAFTKHVLKHGMYVCLLVGLYACVRGFLDHYTVHRIIVYTRCAVIMGCRVQQHMTQTL